MLVDDEAPEFDEVDEEYQAHLRRELLAWEKQLHALPDKDTTVEMPDGVEALDDDDMRFLLYRHCKNKKELNNWIKIFLRIDLPDTCVDPDSTSNPMDMVWKLYETAVFYDDIEPVDRYLKSVFYCSRGSFKTLGACVAEILIMLHAQRDTVHIGLIESQAKTAYNKYFRPFLDLPYLKDYVKKSTTLNRSELVSRYIEDENEAINFKDMTNDNITTLEVIPLTLNKTSSPRAHLICKDEIDKCKGEQVMAYENAYGMLTMTNDRKMAMEFDISSRDSAFGKVQELIENAEKTGTKVEHWNRIDITERCPDSRSGTKPVPYYIKKDTLTVIVEDEYIKLTDDERKEYDMEWGLEGCVKNCKIFAACKGYLKNQTSKCKWLKPVEETQQAILAAPSEEMALSQLLCRLPPKKGLVYSNFNKKRNVKSAADMYEIYTGERPRNEDKFTTEKLIAIFQKDRVDCYVGCDAGFWNPAALLIYIDDTKNIYVVKELMPHEVDSPQFSKIVKDNFLKYRPIRAYVDVESPDLVRAIRKSGFVVPEKLDKKRQPGIATVKGFIKPPAEDFTKLFINKECMGLITEFGKYPYKVGPDGKPTDEADKIFDHALDALRYVLHALFGKNRGILEQGKRPKPPKITKEYEDKCKKAAIKNALSPKAVAGRMGHTVLINTKKDVEEPGHKSVTGFDLYDTGELDE